MDCAFWLQVLLTAIPIALTAFVEHMRRKYEKREQERQKAAEKLEKQANATALGLQSLLRNSIIQLHDKCLRDGRKKTYYDTQNMDFLYQAYHGLGGNGMVTDVYNDFKTFESIPREM